MNPRKFLVWAIALVGVVLAVNAQPVSRSVDDYDDLDVIMAGRYPSVSWVAPTNNSLYIAPISASNAITLQANAGSRR